jgi:Domain of unknown function (DUF4287)
MTFEAYLSAIKTKTGRTAEQIKADATKAGVYSSDMKATALVAWLKSEHGLGHGHSMAVWAVWKNKGWVQAPSGKKK